MLAWTLCLLSALSSTLPGETAYITAATAQRAGNYAEAIAAYREAARIDESLRSFAAVRIAQCQASSGNRQEAIKALNALAKGEDAAAMMAKGHLARLEAAGNRHAIAAPHFIALLDLDYRPWWMDEWVLSASDSVLRDTAHASHGYELLAHYVINTGAVKPRLEVARKLVQSPKADHRAIAMLGMMRSSAMTDSANAVLSAPTSFEVAGQTISWTDILPAHATAAASEAEGPTNFEKLYGAQPENPWLPAFLAWAARTRGMAGDAAAALEAGNILSRYYPDSRDTGDALWSLSLHFKDSSPETAIMIRRRLAESCPSHFRADDALFENAKYFEGKGDVAAAVAEYDLLAKLVPDMRLKPEAMFRAATLLRKDSPTEARKRLQLAYKDALGNFYAHRALQMVAKKTAPGTIFVDGKPFLAPAAGLTAPSAPLPRQLTESAAIERLRLFARHGLEEAEWEALQLLANPDPRVTSARYRAAAEAGIAHSALEIADSRKWGVGPGGARTLDRWRLEFPRAYWPIYLSVAQEAGLDPYLLLAISKQESTFRPALKSSAGATGVMQLMPGTANWMAKTDPNIGPEHVANLESPLNSIRLGAFYIKQMLDRSGGNLVYALASYNAGPGNCDKWRTRFANMSTESFIENIPFDETRDYVKKVSGNLAAYHSLYPPVDWSKTTLAQALADWK